MSSTQTDAKIVLAQRIQDSVSTWWEAFWAYIESPYRDQFVEAPNCAVIAIGGDGDDDADLQLVLTDFVLSDKVTTMGAEILRTSKFVNDGNATVTETFAYSTTKTDSFAFKFAQGLKVGTKAQVKAGLSFLATAQVQVSGEITFNAEQTWTTTVSETFSDTVSIQVPPHSRVDATATLETQTGSFSFTGKAVQNDPDLHVQLSLQMKNGTTTTSTVPIKVMLPNAEDRTIPVSGTLDGVLGLDVTVSTTPIAVNA